AHVRGLEAAAKEAGAEGGGAGGGSASDAAGAQAVESAACDDARGEGVAELSASESLPSVRARVSRDEEGRLPHRRVLGPERSRSSDRRGERQTRARVRDESVRGARESTLQRSVGAPAWARLGRSLSPARSHEPAPSSERPRLLHCELQEAFPDRA